MDFPGGRVPFTSAFTMTGGPDAPANPMPCYRTIDSAGGNIPDAVIPHPLGRSVNLLGAGTAPDQLLVSFVWCSSHWIKQTQSAQHAAGRR